MQLRQEIGPIDVVPVRRDPWGARKSRFRSGNRRMTDPAVGVAISVKPIAGGSVIRVSAGQRTASDFRGANKSQLSIRAVRWVVRATSGDCFVDGAKARIDETRIRRRTYRREDPEEI